MSDSEEDVQTPSSDDEDYVPGADSDEGSEDEKKVRRSKRSYAHKSMPKRACKRKGISLAEDSDEDEDEDEVYLSEGDQESEEEESEQDEDDIEQLKKKEEMEKKRIEDLWESFKSDTSGAEKNKKNLKDEDVEPKEKEKPKTVKVTQTFEFAGEEVKVTKEVDAESEEAKNADQPESESSEGSSKATVPTRPLPPKRRAAGGLGSVLSTINKKPKLSTLDKSKIDWEEYKEETGISDELRSRTKGGYLEKQEFLQRADYKQWENERELRLATSKFKK